MQSALYQNKYEAIVYDADRLPRPNSTWFDEGGWPQIEKTMGGRGGSWLINSEWGKIVLKHYRRGGWAARVTENRYWFRGWEKSRAFIEWRLLAGLYQRKLPVPVPLAAYCQKYGMTYRCALITKFIPRTVALQHMPFDQFHQAHIWRRVGYALRQFVDAGVEHVDLNLGNILCDSEEKIYWVDFDRARVRQPGFTPKAMIRRLLRSIQQRRQQDDDFSLEDSGQISQDQFIQWLSEGMG